MKMPIILWLAMLEPEVFNKAVANIKNQGMEEFMYNEVTSLRIALIQAFVWSYTKEKNNYWAHQGAIAPVTENREVK